MTLRLEGVNRMCSIKELFLKFFQKVTCTGVVFNKVAAWFTVLKLKLDGFH